MAKMIVVRLAARGANWGPAACTFSILKGEDVQADDKYISLAFSSRFQFTSLLGFGRGRNGVTTLLVVCTYGQHRRRKKA